MGMTQQYFHIIFTSCTILQCIPKSSLQVHYPIHITTHQQDTQPCSLHSLPHTTICAMFSSNKLLILQHAIQTQHCSCTPQLLHTRQTTSAMLSSKPQHDFSMHINMHYILMQHYPPYCLPHPSYHMINKHKA